MSQEQPFARKRTRFSADQKNKEIEFFQGWLGKRVKKLSNKPFCSGRLVNTVKEVVLHSITGKPAFRFNEDESEYECWQCERSEWTQLKPQ